MYSSVSNSGWGSLCTSLVFLVQDVQVDYVPFEEKKQKPGILSEQNCSLNSRKFSSLNIRKYAIYFYTHKWIDIDDQVL